MADPYGSYLSLAWLWIIEYLASFPQIDASILHDLIEAAPELPDNLGKSTREMVALRCLEDLFGPNNRLANGVCSADPKVVFHRSESCEHVLQMILGETSISDLKIAGLELLKWDIHPFIMHKRASMPKCGIEKLKDAILDSHPSTASLKELGGLVHTNDEFVGITMAYGDRNEVAWGIDGRYADAQIMEPERNFISRLLDYQNGVVGDDSHDRNLLPSKRDMSDLDNENLDGDRHENRGFMDGVADLHSDAKRYKQDPSHPNSSLGQISVPLYCDKLVEDSSERMVGVAEEDFHVEKNYQLHGLQESSSRENGHDNCVAVDADDEFQVNQFEIAHNADKMPRDTYGDRPHQRIVVDEINSAETKTQNGAPSIRTWQKVSHNEAKDTNDYGNQLKSQNVVSLNGIQKKLNVDKAKDCVEHLCKEAASSDSDQYHHERVGVAGKKTHFLSSQCILSHDSLATVNWTERNNCVKCNKGGEVLVCSADTCLVVVHENCLGSSANFDDKGNFFCPFCSYSRAISKYLKAKKKASLVRKELAAFIRIGLEHQTKEYSERLNLMDCATSRKNGDDDLHKIPENGNLGGIKCNQADVGGHLGEANYHESQKRQSNKKQPQPLASCTDIVLWSGEEVRDVTGRTIHICTGEKEGKGMVEESPYVGGLHREDHVLADTECNDNNLWCKNREIVPNQRQAAEAIPVEDLEQHITNSSEKTVGAVNTDGEEISADENTKSMFSNYSVRFPRGEIKYTYPAIPQCRRKKVPWAPEEEDTLKEGVQKFSNIHDRNIPWKQILEYGSSIFQNGRTTMDLKDKWRNMCKSQKKS